MPDGIRIGWGVSEALGAFVTSPADASASSFNVEWSATR